MGRCPDNSLVYIMITNSVFGPAYLRLSPAGVIPESLWISGQRTLGETDKLDGRDPDGSHYAMEDWTMHRNQIDGITGERLADQYHVGQASIMNGHRRAKMWKGYHERKLTHPAQVADLVERIEQYRLDMESLGLLDHQLDGDYAGYLEECF